jgi:hypothetical protein
MAKPQVLFHEALHRIVCARGLIGERADKARNAIHCYMRVLKRAAMLAGDRTLEKILIDCELTELEKRLHEWKLVGSETALVCDASLAVVRRERIENLCDRRLSDLMPEIGQPRTNRSASS